MMKIVIINGDNLFENILIATDGSKHSEKAANLGIDLAKLSGGKVAALYVADVDRRLGAIGSLSPHAIEEVVTGVRKILVDEGENVTARVEEMAKNAGVNCEKMVIEGHPASEIMRISEEKAMDIIVMGSIGITGLKKFVMGSVAEKVTRNSKVPVLLAP
jgi:nucleotide-binding universal stress UspA family protein